MTHKASSSLRFFNLIHSDAESLIEGRGEVLAVVDRLEAVAAYFVGLSDLELH